MADIAVGRPAARDHHVNPWLVLVLVCMAQFMVILDATIVNVALPSIQTDLKMSDSDLQWIVNAYTLMFGGFLLLGGRAGDLAGARRYSSSVSSSSRSRRCSTGSRRAPRCSSSSAGCRVSGRR